MVDNVSGHWKVILGKAAIQPPHLRPEIFPREASVPTRGNGPLLA